MATIVAGIYKQGKIELLTIPAGLQEGPVLVTVEQASATKEPCLLPYGRYREGKESTVEDFKIAEWRGETETTDE
jgi:hypothetical protein